MTIFQAKSQFAKELSQFSPTPQLDVEVIFSHFLQMDKTQLLMNRDKPLSEEQISNLQGAIEKRKTGLPVSYITGHREFFGYDFLVNPSVLIPKPDTEILVENAIQIIKEKYAAEKSEIEGVNDRILTVCDMCTGSGCIGISVLKALSEDGTIPFDRLPKFTLADISSKALETARLNAEHILSKIERERIRFIQSNLFEQLPMQFDIILTNPPYIPHKMVDELLQDGRNEPRLALDGDISPDSGNSSQTDDGLEIIRNLIPQMQEHLSPNGHFLMETGEYNAKAAERLAQRFAFKTSIIKDLEGQDRVVSGHN